MSEAPIITEHVRQLLGDGPYERPPWRGFLNWLVNATGADYIGVFLRLPDKRVSMVHSYALLDPDSPLHEVFARNDVIVDPMPTLTMEAERVYTMDELLDPSLSDHRAFRDEFLEPNAMRIVQLMRVVEPSGISAWVSLTNSERPLTAQTRRILMEIAAPFRRSLRHYIALERERFRGSVAVSAIERLNYAWVSLDRLGLIGAAGDHTIDMLTGLDAVRIGPDKRLWFTDGKAQAELRDALARFERDPECGPRALRVASDPWLDVLLVPTRAVTPNAHSETVAIAYIHLDEKPTERRHEQIIELFGLLPSEARLALALARGLSIAEAAEEIGITESTARSYSKRIYAKTGARGQVDLVRFVLTSVLALA